MSQNVFVIGDGAEGALGEIERRKFTAEEGDHLTLLNGAPRVCSSALTWAAFTAFCKQGRKSAKWCHQHRLNFKALSRAVSIRQQLAKYLQRFEIPIVSCGSDGVKIRRALTSGYFKNSARAMPDGTYKTIREQAILHVHPSSVMFTRNSPTGYVVRREPRQTALTLQIFHEVLETGKRFMRDLTVIDPDWLPELSGGFYSLK